MDSVHVPLACEGCVGHVVGLVPLVCRECVWNEVDLVPFACKECVLNVVDLVPLACRECVWNVVDDAHVPLACKECVMNIVNLVAKNKIKYNYFYICHIITFCTNYARVISVYLIYTPQNN